MNKMKAYGNIKRIISNFPDNHPKKGYKNWWEFIKDFSKSSERFKSKIDIEKEIYEEKNCFNLRKNS